MMTSRLALLVCSIAMLGGCQTAQQQIKIDQSEPYALSSAQIEKVKKEVLATLKDPYSAHFGEIKAARLDVSNNSGAVSGYVVCGQVNSKNSYGGYVGMTPFVGGFKSDLKEFKLLTLADASGGGYEVIRDCKKAGVVL